jgi:hypothetical protein
MSTDGAAQSYLVECYWPGVRDADAAEAGARAAAASHELSGDGRRVEYLGSVFVPEDETVFFFFSAGSHALVADASRQAGVPFERVLETVVALEPSDAATTSDRSEE